MAQCQVLGPRWRSDRVGLNEAEACERTRQGGGLEEGARDGCAA
jgi:hypothetical protein